MRAKVLRNMPVWDRALFATVLMEWAQASTSPTIGRHTFQALLIRHRR